MVYYIMGVSGCGKTTIGKQLAADLNIPFFDGDDFHPIANINKMSSGQPLNDEDRYPWLLEINQAAKKSLEANGAVFACSALKKTYRQLLQSDIEPSVIWVYLKGDYNTIEERMKTRNHFMPPHLLQSQFDALEEPQQAIVADIDLSPIFILNQIKKELR